jgi:hypothetical protein
MVVNPFRNDGLMNTPNNGLTNINIKVINPGVMTPLGDADRTRQIGFLHDGIHGSIEEMRGLGAGILQLGVEPLQSGHQNPYNKAATDILDRR